MKWEIVSCHGFSEGRDFFGALFPLWVCFAVVALLLPVQVVALSSEPPAGTLLLLQSSFEKVPVFTSSSKIRLSGSYVEGAVAVVDEQAGMVLDLTARRAAGSTGPAAVWADSTELRSALNGLESFTLTFWINGNGENKIPWNGCTWLSLGGQNVWLDALVDDTRLRFKVNGTFVGVTEEAVRLPADGWYFLAVTYDATVAEDQPGCRLYIWSPEEDRSGMLELKPMAMVAKYESVRGGKLKAKGPLVLGANNISGDHGADGKMGEMRWYGSRTGSGGALSCDEIQWVMQDSSPAGVFVTPPPPTPGEEWLFSTHSMDKVLPSVANWSERPVAQSVDLLLARDECESFQLIVVAKTNEMLNASMRISPLVSASGELLSVRSYSVEYSLCGPSARAYPTLASGRWPDPLFPVSSLEVPAGECRSWWLTVEASEKAVPGDYTGVVHVRCERGERVVSLTVRVLPVTLPRGTFNCHVGLYWPQFSDWYRGSHEYLGTLPPDVLIDWVRFLKRYRITPKNLGYEYRAVQIGEECLPSMGDNLGRLLLGREDADQVQVDLSKTARVIKETGPWPDYTLSSFRLPPFDEFLIDKEDKKSGSDPDLSNPDRVVMPVNMFLREWTAQGLPAKSYLYGIDEPRAFQIPMLKKIYKAIKAESPEVNILQVISHGAPQDLEGLVDIWCPITPMLRKESVFFEKQVDKGCSLWAYVCRWPRFPYGNFFIDRPGIESRLLFLQVLKKGATGLLYWSCDWWTHQPSLSASAHFPEIPFKFDYENVSGDGVLVYPGPDETPWPSIRLEQMRDGIEDAESVLLLHKLLRQARFEGVPESKLQGISQWATIPDSISKNLVAGTEDPELLMDYRRNVLMGIAELSNIAE